jgi:hypothetical protein
MTQLRQTTALEDAFSLRPLAELMTALLTAPVSLEIPGMRIVQRREPTRRCPAFCGLRATRCGCAIIGQRAGRAVNRRGGQFARGFGSNTLKENLKDQPGWGHDRRRLGPQLNADSVICHKELLSSVQGTQFGADLQMRHETRIRGSPPNRLPRRDQERQTA